MAKRKSSPHKTLRRTRDVNGWAILRRVYYKPSGYAYGVPCYLVKCPACQRTLEMMLPFIETNATCQSCTNSITALLQRIGPEMTTRIVNRYTDHLIACKQVGTTPSSVAVFLLDYLTYPELLEEESIVFADLPTSASPLTWGNVPDVK